MVKCLGRWGKHDIKQGPEGREERSVTGTEGDQDVVNNERDTQDKVDDEDLEICCLSGCLTSITVAILFFLALPTGILLCVFASGNNDQEVFAVGIVLAISPLISMPLIVVVLYNRRRIKRLRKRKVSSTPDTPATYTQRY